jgi:hypothetical protein
MRTATWITARQIQHIKGQQLLRKIEDGPVGGTSLSFGDEKIGEAIDAPLPSSGVWNLNRISDLSLAQTAYELTRNNLCWLPRMPRKDACELKIRALKDIKAQIGPYHSDIYGSDAKGGVRGPFDLRPVQPDEAPTYPALDNHEADRERTICFGADSSCQPKAGADPEIQETIDRKVEQVWASASNCHFNENFRFNSQSTAMQYTPERSLGGRAWKSLKLASQNHEKALVLWANTSLGLLLHWWHANKQQSGRGNIGIVALKSLPIFDVDSLSKAQLQQSAEVFKKFKDKSLLRFSEIDQDNVRKQLDVSFLGDVLGLDASILEDGGPLDTLRQKLAREPSVTG